MYNQNKVVMEQIQLYQAKKQTHEIFFVLQKKNYFRKKIKN